MTIDDLLSAQASAASEIQPISWNRSMWEKVWTEVPFVLPGKQALDLIDAEFNLHGTIRRRWLHQLADGDPVTFLVASVVWGYGSFGRGVRALRAMLRGCERAPQEALQTIIREARQSSASGFSALFDNRGRPQIPWLGVAYGTKVLHFAGYGHATPAPLILDKRVWLGATDLADNPPVPDPGGYVSSIEYEAYCAWAGTVAARHGLEAADVEYALFVHGGHVRSARRGT